MAVSIEPLPFREAIAAFQRRTGNQRPTHAWQDMFQEEHARAFTVAKSAGFDILDDISKALQAGLEDGDTFRDFTKELTPILQAKGWWGRQLVEDPQTGEKVPAQLGSVRRLQTIFDANMRVSYATGHWSSFERNRAARPYLRYVHLEEQPHPRWQHHLWHNTVLPIDHPWWKTHACPNGWGCHCTIQSLSQRDVDRLLAQGVPLKFEAPEVTYRDWTNKRTGEITRVPDGIDPGWAYNPGQAGYQAGLLAADKLVAAPPPLAAAAARDSEWLEPLGDDFAAWFDQAAEGGAMNRTTVTVGALDPRVLQAVTARGEAPRSAAVTLQQSVVRHMIRDAKADAGRAVPTALLRQIPHIVANPRAVLRDRRSGGLIYVFDVPGDDRRGKLAITVDFSRRGRQDGRRVRTVTNAIRTAGMVQVDALQDPNSYELIFGSL